MSKIKGNWINAGNTQVLGEVSSQLGSSRSRGQGVWIFIVSSKKMNVGERWRSLKQGSESVPGKGGGGGGCIHPTPSPNRMHCF